MGNVLVNDAYLYGIANALREKHGTENLYKPSEMEDAVRGIQSGGSSEEFGEDWFLNGFVGRSNMSYAFYQWNNETIPMIDTSDAITMDYCFCKSKIISLPVLDTSKVTSFRSFVEESSINTVPPFDYSAGKNFYAAFNRTKIERIENVDFSNATDIRYLCGGTYGAYLKYVEKIDCPLVTTNGFQLFVNQVNLETIGYFNMPLCTNYASTFSNLTSLKNIAFGVASIKASVSFASSSLLSDASIQSIIDGLADLTGQDAQTITFHADVKAKLTEEQIATITSKNWTLA